MDNISLRPVYGKKTATSITTTVPTTSSITSSPSTTHPNSQKSTSSPSTVPHNAVPAKKKESADEQDIDKTDAAKAYYSKSFLKKIQAQCTDAPPELQPIFDDYPELKPVTRRSGEQPRSPSSPQREHRQQQGQKKPYNSNNKKGPQQPQSPQQKQQQQQPQQQSKKAWNPQFFFNEKEQFLRTVQGTLNKLTPDTFDKLSHQIVDMIVQCNNAEMYAEAVSMVFIKAVGEINFTRLYTQLCVKLNETQPKLTDPDSFRKILLAKCQQEFEAVASGEAAETNLPEDPDERAAFKDKQRKRKIGNVKFIGELFKAKLLSERIVHDCIRHLVSDILKYKTDAQKEDREFNAELLTKLLTTVGKFLDHEKGKQYMDTYFAQVSKFAVDSQQFSSRIRFLLQDLLELRSSRWVPRRQENTPKTISEVHAEAAMKEFEDDFGVAPVSPRPPPVAATPTQPQPSTEASKAEAKPKPKPAKKKQPQKPKQPETLTIDEPVFISSEGEYEEKIKPILQDYMSNPDLKTTVSAIRDLEAPEYRHKLVENAIVQSLEKSDKEREAMSKLLSALSSDKLLKEDNYVKGFKAVAAMIPDLKPDIPRIGQYVQQFVTNAVSTNALSSTAANKIGLSSNV